MEWGVYDVMCTKPRCVSSSHDDPTSTKVYKRKRRPASQHTPSVVEGSSHHSLTWHIKHSFFPHLFLVSPVVVVCHAFTLLPEFHQVVFIFNIPLGSGYSFIYVRCHCNCKSAQHPVGDAPWSDLIGYYGYSIGGSLTGNCTVRFKIGEAPTWSGAVKKLYWHITHEEYLDK